MLSVIRRSCYYFLDRILFHCDFHHDSCDYHYDFMASDYFLNYTLGCIYLSSSGSANAHTTPWMGPPLGILLEYWIEHVTFGLLYVMFTFPAGIFSRGVPGFATACPCSIWCCGLTTCFLHVGPLFGNLVKIDSRSVSFTQTKTTFLLLLIVSHLHALQYNTLFSFTLLSCLK